MTNTQWITLVYFIFPIFAFVCAFGPVIYEIYLDRKSEEKFAQQEAMRTQKKTRKNYKAAWKTNTDKSQKSLLLRQKILQTEALKRKHC